VYMENTVALSAWCWELNRLRMLKKAGGQIKVPGTISARPSFPLRATFFLSSSSSPSQQGCEELSTAAVVRGYR